MKLYSKNTGKFALFFGAGLFLTILCSFLFFGGVVQSEKRAFADDSTNYTMSLDGFTTEQGTYLPMVDGVYQVNNVDDLRALAYFINYGTESAYSLYASASYKLNSYLDLSGYAFWEAIGTAERPFMGVFNGNGYSIYGLTIIDREFVDGTTTVDEGAEAEQVDTYRGLFGYVKYNGTTAAEIKNLGLKDTLIKTKGTYTGGLIGRAEGDTAKGNALVKVSECYNTGYVEGSDYVGGLIGSMEQCAAIKDSYFAGTVRDLDRYLGEVVNSEYDVATNIEAGYVGGLAGSAVDNSVDRIIENCYNAGVVGKTGDFETVRGALVGYKGDLKTTNLKRNFYLRDVLPDATSTELRGEGGSNTNLGNIKQSFLTNLFFQVDAAGSGANDYLPTNPSKTWQWSSKVNNGLPFLKDTQQLVRIEFDSRQVSLTTNEDSSVTVTDEGQIESDDIVNVIDDDNCCLRVGNKFFTRMISDNTIFLHSNIAPKSDADYSYKFYRWSVAAFERSFANGTSSAAINASRETTTTSYSDIDKIFVANFVEREYEVSLTANDLSRVGENGLIIKSGETTLDAGQKVKFGAPIALGVTPAAGYKLISFATPATDENFVTYENGIATLDTASYIRKIGEGAEADNIAALSVVANLEPETYKIAIQSNRADCATAAAVKNNAGVILHNGDDISYHQTVYLTIDPIGIAANYKFAGWQYQVVDAGATPVNAAWIDITEAGEREDSIDFVIPDVEDGQQIYFMANFKKITYTLSIEAFNVEAGSISLKDSEGISLADNEFDFDEPVYVSVLANNGYYFNSVIINGNSYTVGESAPLAFPNASWDAENSRIIFSALTGNVTVSANFRECEYDVNLSVVSTNVISTATDVIEVNSQSSVLNRTNTALFNKEFEFKVNLEEGYEIQSVTANNVDLVALSDGVYVCKITGNTDIKVTISKKSFTVVANFAYNDVYNYYADDSCIRGAGSYYYGSTFGINVDLPEMFVITSWTINGVRNSNISTYWGWNNITENFDIVINLGIKTSQISFGQVGDSGAGEWYSIHRNGVVYQYVVNMSPLTVNYGDIVEFNINDQYFVKNGRNSMYAFAYWQVNGKSITAERAFSLKVNGEDILVEAVFKPALIAISIDCYELNPITSATTPTDSVGSVRGLASSFANYGETVSLVANAYDGYQFVEWRDGNGNLLTSSSVYSFTVTKEAQIRAVFVMVKTVSVIVEDEQGEVTGAGKKVVGDTVVLNATAKKGYRFVSWNEGGLPISTDAEYRFTMLNSDVLLTAVFEQVYVIDYSTNDSSLGQVIGSTSGRFKENITLEAVSANNCSFVGWMIDNVMISTSTKLNISLNGDVRVQALFKKNFDWNIIIVILGSAIFAVVMVYGAIAYIKSKEAQPIHTRALIGGKDDSEIIKKVSKRNALRDEIAPVPTRKQQRVNVQPIPVRKIVVEPTDHKGNKVKANFKAKDKKQTLGTEEE